MSPDPMCSGSGLGWWCGSGMLSLNKWPIPMPAAEASFTDALSSSFLRQVRESLNTLDVRGAKASCTADEDLIKKLILNLGCKPIHVRETSKKSNRWKIRPGPGVK